MRKLAPIIVISVFIIALNACRTDKGNIDPSKIASVEEDIIIQKDWKTFDKTEYSIQYPENWNLDSSGIGGSMFTISSALNSNDVITENVNMQIENLSDDIGLDEFAKDAITKIASVFTILTKERIKSDKDDYYRLVFSGEKNGVGVKVEQRYRVKNKKAYVIGFMSSKSDFEKDKVIGEKIVNSFKLK